MKKNLFLFAVLALGLFVKTACAQTAPNNIPSGIYYPGTNLVVVPGFRLEFQVDGNLVLYSTGSNGRALWSSVKQVSDASRCLVSGYQILLYRSSDPSYAYWSSPFAGPCQNSLVLQNDGNLVRYYSDCAGHYYSESTGTNGGQVSSHQGTFQ